MKLEQLLEGLVKISENDLRRIQGVEIGGLAIDSRRANKGDLFMALAGSKQHGLSYAQAAIGNGVSAVLFDPAGAGNRLAQTIAGIPLIPIENLGNALGNLAARFYGEPTRHLNVMGITGTNGKTSCSQFLGQMLDDCGIIGTLGWGKWEQLNDTVNTTPDALTLQTIMAEFVNSTTKNVAMEVSSIGLDQGRVNGVQFTGAVFTNFTRDHLDYHETMSAYLDAKLQLMRMPGLKFAVINLDDDSWETIASTVPRSTTLWGVSANGNHWNLGENLVANHLEHTDQGIQFAVQWRGVTQRFKVPLYGDFNVENVLCVLSVMLAMGHRFDESATKMQSIQPIKGRMERCGTTVADMSVFVDYAPHTGCAVSSIVQLTKTLQPILVGCLWLRRRPRCGQTPGNGLNSRAMGGLCHHYRRQPAQ